MLGSQTFPNVLSSAIAQTGQVPPDRVVVTGTSSGSSIGYVGSGLGFYGSSYSSGGSLSGGVPEAEAFGRAPAPPPKTEEQRRTEREQCNTDRNWKMSVFQTGISGQVQACAARYAANNIFTVVEVLKNLVGTSCAKQIARETEAAAMKFDAEHAQCMAKANGP
jgi:hypothetical protein